MSDPKKPTNTQSSFWNKRNKIIASLCFLVLVAAAAGVGFWQGGESSTAVTLPLTVGSIGDPSANSKWQKRSSVDLTHINNAFKSTTSSSWAKVDSLLLGVVAIRFDSVGIADQAISYSIPKTIDIGGSANTIPITDSVSLTSSMFNKQYQGLDMIVTGSYQVKAYCFTSSGLLYTTKNGAALASNSSTVLPADYDYATYTSNSARNNDNTFPKLYLNQVYPIMFNSTNFNISIMLENTYTVIGYDSSHNGITGASFDLDFNLPIFINLGLTGQDLSLYAESYVVSSQGSMYVLDPSTGLTSFTYCQVITFAFRKSDDSLFEASIQPNGNQNFQFFSNFVVTNGTNYTFNDGNWYGKGYRYLADRFVAGFQRTDNISLVFTTQMTDGPDCGQTLIDYDNQNAARSCLGAGVSVTHYWKRLSRL